MGNRISESELLSIIRTLPSALDGLNFQTETHIERAVDLESWIKVVNNEIVVQYSGNYVEDSLSILAEEPVILKVNHIPVRSKVSLQHGDQITWSVKDLPLFELLVTPDEMKVYLTVHDKERYAYKLKDTPPRQHAMVEIIEDKQKTVSTLTPSDIMIKLQKLNITKNIDYVSISNEVLSPTQQPVLIAQGLLPIPGQDADLTLYFEDKAVKTGDLIAKKKEPIAGIPGYNVYGQILFPAPPKDIQIASKNNVKITASGEIYALASGRPKILGQDVKYFDISKELVVNGNVDKKTGNITFSGDVIIYGDVSDQMIIEALGSVYIMGNVKHSTITATGNITVKGNVTNSHLYSGYFGVVFNRLYSQTKKIVDVLANLLDAANYTLRLLEDQGRSSAEGAILHVLIQSKFPTIYNQINVILTVFQGIKREIALPDWNEYKQSLIELKQLASILNTCTLQTVAKTLACAKQIYSNVELMQEQSIVIEIAQCTGSTLKSNGDIKVRKEGSVQSHLFAKDQIIYDHLDSVCRGGELEAGNSIYLIAVSGSSGAETTLIANKKIMAKKIYLAKVCIGKWVEYIYEPLQDVTVFSEKGRIKIQGERITL
jgi:uncharacterized protein (DUF342 family)